MQGFWGRRLVALIIDAVFITLLLWGLTALIYPLISLINIYAVLNYWLVMLGIIILLYFMVMEGKWSTTLGKGLLHLKVQTTEGEMNYKRALIRNLSKFLWLPLVVDIIMGSKDADGTRQRYLDNVARTRVVKIDKQIHPSLD